jgi:hypothetical protein
MYVNFTLLNVAICITVIAKRSVYENIVIRHIDTSDCCVEQL